MNIKISLFIFLLPAFAYAGGGAVDSAFPSAVGSKVCHAYVGIDRSYVEFVRGLDQAYCRHGARVPGKTGQVLALGDFYTIPKEVEQKPVEYSNYKFCHMRFERARNENYRGKSSDLTDYFYVSAIPADLCHSGLKMQRIMTDGRVINYTKGIPTDFYLLEQSDAELISVTFEEGESGG